MELLVKYFSWDNWKRTDNDALIKYICENWPRYPINIAVPPEDVKTGNLDDIEDQFGQFEPDVRLRINVNWDDVEGKKGNNVLFTVVDHRPNIKHRYQDLEVRRGFTYHPIAAIPMSKIGHQSITDVLVKFVNYVMQE